MSAAVLPEEPKMPPPPRDDGASLASFGKREYASNIKPSSAKQVGTCCVWTKHARARALRICMRMHAHVRMRVKRMCTGGAGVAF